MKLHYLFFKTPTLWTIGAAACMVAAGASAQVQSGTTGIDTSGNYQQEVKACMSGQTQQDRETCLQEARNAQADKKRGLLDNNTDTQRLAANSTARCENLFGEEKGACLARMMGYGNTTGSVAAGGVLREVETVVLPPGTRSMTIEAQTDNPVVLVPAAP